MSALQPAQLLIASSAPFSASGPAASEGACSNVNLPFIPSASLSFVDAVLVRKVGVKQHLGTSPQLTERASCTNGDQLPVYFGFGDHFASMSTHSRSIINEPVPEVGAVDSPMPTASAAYPVLPARVCRNTYFDHSERVIVPFQQLPAYHATSISQIVRLFRLLHRRSVVLQCRPPNVSPLYRWSYTGPSGRVPGKSPLFTIFQTENDSCIWIIQLKSHPVTDVWLSSDILVQFCMARLYLLQSAAPPPVISVLSVNVFALSVINNYRSILRTKPPLGQLSRRA